ncbi:hypothetical protein ARMGADRAFT_1037795 [Armillaria gallica]|uniref:Uncharacterized protein n=1 Tax=Armillaria gallica TaxID=47427 RepID=A0A2H3CKL2_ARMGA|nr:hypothetical protein ARMGADRAFT_1037795 [Armillaria gallica]
MPEKKTEASTKNNSDENDNGDRKEILWDTQSNKNTTLLKLLSTRITFNHMGNSLSAKNRDCEVQASRWPGAEVQSSREPLSSIDDNKAAESEGETIEVLIGLRCIPPLSFLFIN